MRRFDVPDKYKSGFISKIKSVRRAKDARKKDFSPTKLDFGRINFFLARHFGFCFGVENAVDIAYKTIHENSGKNIYLLSEIIHNPGVNYDLQSNGIKFIFDSHGRQFVSWDEINRNDIIIIPAFGISLETEKLLNDKGIDAKKYNAVCPFVERVWTRAYELNKEGFTVIVHGKHYHEETKATFSHSSQSSPSIIIRDINESKILGNYILNGGDETELLLKFKDKYSTNFRPSEDLRKIGVVNQTTMLASETQMISDYFKNIMIEKYGEAEMHKHFADTRDTLCYATNDNQNSAQALSGSDSDFALVVGGFNSSNTLNLAKLVSGFTKCYHIESADNLISPNEIQHFDAKSKTKIINRDYMPDKSKIKIAITAGASCPDAVVEKVIYKILGFYDDQKKIGILIEEALSKI